MSGAVNRVVVDIFGTQYNLKGEEPVESLEKVASLVDNRMREIRSLNPRLNVSQTAILAALNIADEFLKLRKEYDTLEELLQEVK
jgi:cell division protein ZapA